MKSVLRNSSRVHQLYLSAPEGVDVASIGSRLGAKRVHARICSLQPRMTCCQH